MKYFIEVIKVKGAINESSKNFPKSFIINSKQKISDEELFYKAERYLKENYNVTLLEAKIDPAVQRATKRMAKNMFEWIEMSYEGDFEEMFMNEDDGSFNEEELNKVATEFNTRYNRKKLANVRKAVSLCRAKLNEEGVPDWWSSKDRKCLKALLARVVALA